jgi:phosphoglycolate phosphatase
LRGDAATRERRFRDPMTRQPTIAFDLDGTLVDSAPDLLATLNVVLGEAGFAAIGAEDARGLFGGGARVLIERGLSLHGANFSEPEIDRLFRRYLAYYDEHIADHSRPYPGAKTMLDEMSVAGATLLVCTNKLERFAAKLLKRDRGRGYVRGAQAEPGASVVRGRARRRERGRDRHGR